MTWWDHFLADAVPTAVMFVIVVGALVTSHVVVLLTGIRWGRRDVLRAIADMRQGWEKQIELTVPMLSAAAREVDR